MWIYILSKRVKYCTKEILKYFNIIIVAFGLITAIILIKYKPIYKVSIAGTELVYTDTKKSLQESIKNEIIQNENVNVDSVEIKDNPDYELKLVNRDIETSNEQIVSSMKDNIIVTYKYYEIALENDVIEKVNTIDEAEELTNILKEENKELNLTIDEKYTQNEDEVNVADMEIAKKEISVKANQVLEKQEDTQTEEKQEDSTPTVNGIKLAVKPITGTITSRYGVSSRIRKSNHTGLDIATSTGTPIKVVADGTITNASYSGSYGNLVKVSHGNGVETWYAHTSKMYVTVGQKVNAGDVIAAVGSTGNSTGAHLHLEIRINGQHVNPQKYLYK